MSTRTVGQFLKLIKKHKNRLWFVPRVGGQISLGGHTGRDFLETIVSLEHLKLPATYLPVKGRCERLGALLRIKPSFAHNVLMATAFREYDLHIVLTPYNGMSTKTVEKLIVLRQTIIKTLGVVDTLTYGS